MKPTEKHAFLASVAVIAETVNKKISPALIKTYWACLKDYDFSEVEHALSELLKNPDVKKHPYFPSPRDVIAIIHGDINEKSLLAWTEVKKAISEIGQYDSVIFSDKLIHAVIRDLGGWICLCQHTEKALTFAQREFERLYRLYWRKRPKVLPPQLSGRLAHENSVNGYVKFIPNAINVSTTHKEIKKC